MSPRQSFVVQPFLRAPDGHALPTLGGLETDDQAQALRRAARLWESGAYAGVMVTRAHCVVASFGLDDDEAIRAA